MINKEDILEIQALMMYNKDLKMELEICRQSIEELENENKTLKAKIRDYEAGIISDCPMCDCEDSKE